ncbi:hypothetical protein L207DRAFT_458328 [Hyaloscypha variabilis F]|uniref:WW domain-containing protein n=1 Tax=Hyaloscypha variabilis (strain UAMH 11265 / GT02V1 / F) TaxID=1149755 RepID=A0A2J6RTC3_HYAVF|nr:hypothetical protein L207DRAFT_458328 [Hyaloscypha variabilis F]
MVYKTLGHPRNGTCCRCHFLVGSAVLGFPLFQSAILWIRCVRYAIATLERISGFELIEQTCETLVCDLGVDLVQVVFLARSKQCIDPRDKIYAILSLLSSSFSTRVIPDYLRPPEEIFKEIVLHHIGWIEQLGLLSLCRFSDPTSNLVLPSWVLDFSASSNLLCWPYCAASGKSKQESIYNPSFDSLQIYGQQICTIDKIFEAVPFDSKLPETLAICQSWEKAWKSATPQDGVVFDENLFLAVIFSGPLSQSSVHNVDMDVRQIGVFYRTSCEQDSFQPYSIKNGSKATQYGRTMSLYLQGCRFFVSSSGLVGLCPSWAAEGDIIIVALGCDMPLVLRPAGSNRYNLGGGCFVHGMMYGEALLGPLIPGSRYSWKMVAGHTRLMTEDSDGIATQLDPRAGPLPPGWSVFYGSKSGEPGPEIVDGEFQGQWFRHSETGKVTYFDPRLTSENLRKRGVDMQEFVLV